MKRINYDTYRQEKGAELQHERVALMNRFPKRLPRQRPRDPEEEALLGRLIDARYRRLLETGELVHLGPRRWRWIFPEFRT